MRLLYDCESTKFSHSISSLSNKQGSRNPFPKREQGHQIIEKAKHRTASQKSTSTILESSPIEQGRRDVKNVFKMKCSTRRKQRTLESIKRAEQKDTCANKRRD